MSEKKIVIENVEKIEEPEFKSIISKDSKKIENEIKKNGNMTFDTKKEKAIESEKEVKIK